jgi:hypothetical protein
MFTTLAVGIQFLISGDNADIEGLSVANQLYDTGHYREAVKIYEQLLAQGMTNSAIYYNLGNAYLEQGDRGRAILNYQRAAQLDPRDPDIRANLAFARSQAASVQENTALGPIKSLSSLTSSWLTLNETAIITLVSWFVLGFLVIAFRQFQAGKIRGMLRYGIACAVLLFTLAGFSFATRLYVESTQPEGVIIVDAVIVNSAPGADFATEFSLHNGAEVRLLEVQGSWVHLSGPNDILNGWIPLDKVEAISGHLESRASTF